MKIALITTLPSLEENERIKAEVLALGHEFNLVDLSDFKFSTQEGRISVENLSGLKTEVAIVRGIFHSGKPISIILNDLKKKGVKIFDNNYLEHGYSIDKVTDLVKLSLNKIDIPKTSYSRDFEDFPKLAGELGYPVVVKSIRMGKGASVFKIESEEKLGELIADLIESGKEAKSYLLQEFIPYQYDLRCLVIGEQVFTMRRIPQEGEFRANFSLGGKVEIFDLDDEGKKLAIKALKSVGMSVGGVDILITKGNKRYILEVNHTAGFVGMEKATGENIGRLFVEHAIKNAK